MYPVMIVLFGIWLSTSYIVLDERERTSQLTELQGDVAATNFLAYREAVVSYLNANPTATGTIADGALTWTLGFIRDTRWTHVITGGQLYVYSTGAPPAGMVQRVVGKTSGYLMVGTKNASGNLISGTGSVITTSLPGTIPAGSLVFAGR